MRMAVAVAVASGHGPNYSPIPQSDRFSGEWPVTSLGKDHCGNSV
jgi:hypothetical protein